jgi:hypothetical protein
MLVCTSTEETKGPGRAVGEELGAAGSAYFLGG